MYPFRNIANAFCVSRERLIEVFDEELVKKAVLRKTIRAVEPGWYEWCTLPNKWQLKAEAKLCQGIAAEKWHQERYGRAIVMELLPSPTDTDLSTIMRISVERARVNPGSGEVWSERRGGLPKDRIAELTTASRWLRLVNLLDDRRCKIELNMSRPRAFEAFVIPLIQDLEVDLPTNYRRLVEKAEEYAAAGAEVLVPKKYGNTNASKVLDEQQSLLVTLYCDPRKPTVEQTWNWYSEIATSAGWKPVALRTVRTHLNRPEVRQLYTLNREGLAEWRKRFGYTFWTSRPTAPNLLWVHDGTKVNYYYRSDTGHRAAKLNVVCVIDAHSSYILGWEFQVGAETSATVRRAVRKAVKQAGFRLPYQYLYDNAGSNTAFFQDYPAVHTPAEPNRGQSKPIEQMFGQMQQYIMRRHVYFTGQNITARSQRAKLNDDAVPHVKTLPTLEEVMHEAALDFEIWNNSPQKALGGKTPAQLYQDSAHPDTMRVNAEMEREMFWEWHANQAGQPYAKRFEATRMMIQQGSEKYHFEVIGADDLPDEQFYALHQGTEFYVKLDPENPGAGAALYLPDGMRYLTTAVERYRAPRAIYDQNETDPKKIRDRIGYQKAQVQAIKDRMEEAYAHLDAEDLTKLGHTYVSKDVLSKAEEALALRNGKTQEPTPEPTPEPVMAPVKKKTVSSILDKLSEHYD